MMVVLPGERPIGLSAGTERASCKTVHYDQHAPFPGKRQVAGDPLNQAGPQNKVHFSTRSNQTNPSAPNRWVLAQASHFCQNTLAGKLAECEAGYLKEFSGESEAFLHFVRLVVNEASALACSTSYPHLVLPALMEEKLHYARRWKSRQGRVSNRLDAAPGATRWEAD